MKPEEIAKWGKIRAKGRTRYILVNGVLSYGLPMFVIMTFLVNRNHLAPLLIGFTAVIWAAAGAFYGVSMWWLLERRYRKATREARQ